MKSKQGHFEPDKFEDRYENAIRDLITKKQKGVTIRGRLWWCWRRWHRDGDRRSRQEWERWQPISKRYKPDHAERQTEQRCRWSIPSRVSRTWYRHCSQWPADRFPRNGPRIAGATERHAVPVVSDGCFCAPANCESRHV
jgi:hypothetical protein